MELVDKSIQQSSSHRYASSGDWRHILYYAYSRLMLLQPLSSLGAFSIESVPETSNVDVLVVGAGPTGSMCAYSLVKAGISVKVIDKNPTPVQRGHADALQPRVLEILASHGLIDEALKHGCRINSTAIYHPGPDGNIYRAKRISNITAPRGLYPFNLTNHQGATESIFLDAMEKLGVKADRPCVPKSMKIMNEDITDPNSYPITVDVQSENSNKIERIHAKYVVGADGAHSWVRKAMNVTSTGDRADRCWGVVDFVPDTNYPDIRCTSQVHSGSGFCLIVPRERDMVRLYIPLDDFEQYVDPETKRVDVKRINPDELLRIAKKAFQPYYMNAPHGYDWFTVYIVGQRVADQFSVSNRVFLAGDACHTHSPKAGQGMNAGINDAHNLAWKLTYVLRGWADQSLLNTYEIERRRFAQDLINFDKKYVAMFEKMAMASVNGKADLTDHADMVETFGLFKNGIGIHYTDSNIVNSQNQLAAKYLTVGKRFPPEHIICAYDDRLVQMQDLIRSDTMFKLLVFTGDLKEEAQMSALQTLADRLSSSPLLLRHKLATSEFEESMKMVEIYSIMRGKRGHVNYMDVPSALRSHWTTVFVDDLDISGVHGGNTYQNFGVESSGAIVIVRPDGYVGTVAPLSDIGTIFDYFKSWFSASM